MELALRNCNVSLVDIFSKEKPRKRYDISSRCCACGSSKLKHPERSFHCFPKNEERCRKWIKRCGLKDLEGQTAAHLNLYCKLCSNHFDESCYSDRQLKLKAIPNRNILFPVKNTNKKTLTQATDGSGGIVKKVPRHRKMWRLPDDDDYDDDVIFTGSTVSYPESIPVNNGAKEPTVVPTTSQVSQTVNKLIQKLPDSHKKIRILRIDNVPTEGENALSATSLEKIRSMLRKFSSEPNCKIEDIIKIVSGSKEDQNAEPVKTNIAPSSTVAIQSAMTVRNATTHQTNIFSTSKNVQSSLLKVSNSEPNLKISGMTAANKVTGEPSKTVHVPSDPVSRTSGINCNICKGRLPVKPGNVVTQKQSSNAVTQRQSSSVTMQEEEDCSFTMQKQSTISYSRQTVKPPIGPTPSVNPSACIGKVANPSEITMTESENYVLEKIQNRNVLATPGVNAKMSFEDIALMEDFHSDRPTIMNVFCSPQFQPPQKNQASTAPDTTGSNAKPPFEDVASLEEFNKDVPTILNVFSYPMERWRTDFVRAKVVKPPKPPKVIAPLVCCRGRCSKCKAEKDQRTLERRRLRRNLQSYTKKCIRLLKRNKELELENRKLVKRNRELSENDLDLLNAPQRRLVDGMLRRTRVHQRGVRYDPLLLNDCLTLRRISRAAYQFAKDKFSLPLPSEHSLRKYNNSMNRIVTNEDPVSSGGGQMPLEVSIHETDDMVLAPVEVQNVAAVEVISSNRGHEEEMPLEVCINEAVENMYDPMEVQTVEVMSPDLGVETVEVMSSEFGGQFYVIPAYDEL